MVQVGMRGYYVLLRTPADVTGSALFGMQQKTRSRGAFHCDACGEGERSELEVGVYLGVRVVCRCENHSRWVWLYVACRVHSRRLAWAWFKAWR